MTLMLLTAFGITVLLLFLLIPITYRINLLAIPGAHRYHQNPTPLIGGIAIFLSFVITTKLFEVDIPAHIMFSFLLIVIFGLIDDQWTTPYWIRFIVQFVAAFILVDSGIILSDLGQLVSDELFTLGRWDYIVSVFAIVGVINAVNMIDGLDGLVGALLLVTLAAILYFLGISQYQNDYVVCGIIFSCIVGFLLFNIRYSRDRPAKIFMGDSGSMFLGLFIAWMLISKSQNPMVYFPPVVALWLVAVPLFDTVGVMIRRIVRKRSPFRADQLHTHHLLQDFGFSVNQTLLLITLVAVAYALVGIICVYLGVAEKTLFYLFIGSFVLYLVLMEIGERAIQK